MAVFWIIGGVGAVLLLVSIVLGDLLDGLFEGVDLGGGIFSTEVIGAFLAAFGFGAALLQRGVGAGTAVAAAGGVGAGVVLAGVALWFSRSIARMPTDPTLSSRDYVGLLGQVLTPIPAGGFGEIAVRSHGQRLKLTARSLEPVARGASVVVVEVISPTAVLVAETDL